MFAYELTMFMCCVTMTHPPRESMPKGRRNVINVTTCNTATVVALLFVSQITQNDVQSAKKSPSLG